MNKSFCSLAWLGITTDPDGSLRPCCISSDHISKNDGTFFNLGKDSLEEIYNSDFYKKLRKDMLNGEIIAGCQTCYNNEKYGRESRRLISNETFKDLQFNDIDIPVNIKYFDLRLGNRCNLKCRMCNPMNSSLIEDENLEHKNPILDSYYQKSLYQFENWYDTDVFDNNINSQINNVHTIYMTGGEPTLIKKNYDILSRLIEAGKHTSTTLIINTNMTNSNPKFYEYLKKFHKVIIQMSVDATGDLATYIRHPSEFEVVDKNVKELCNLEGNILLKATPAIQILNLNKLVELFEYFESFNRKYNKQLIDIRPSFVINPNYFDLINLPYEYKVSCYRKIHMWMIQNCKYQSFQFKDTIKALQKKCYEKYETSSLKDFMKFNNELDKIRNIYLKDYNSELYEVLKIYE